MQPTEQAVGKKKERRASPEGAKEKPLAVRNYPRRILNTRISVAHANDYLEGHVLAAREDESTSTNIAKGSLNPRRW